eukprot:80501-Rhodomonas_salina.1
MSGTDRAYAASWSRIRKERVNSRIGGCPAIRLRARYTMSGTAIAYCVVPADAFSGSEIAYGGAEIAYRASPSCAMSGTEIAYGGFQAS